MPTYDYKCDDCGYEFEKFQMITAKPIRKCPRCGREGVKRLIGVGAGIIFRGSGFYETDYRSESYKKAEKSEKNSVEKKTAAENKKTKVSEKTKMGSSKKESA